MQNIPIETIATLVHLAVIFNSVTIAIWFFWNARQDKKMGTLEEPRQWKPLDGAIVLLLSLATEKILVGSYGEAAFCLGLMILIAIPANQIYEACVLNNDPTEKEKE